MAEIFRGVYPHFGGTIYSMTFIDLCQGPAEIELIEITLPPQISFFPSPSHFLFPKVTIARNWHKWLCDIFTLELNKLDVYGQYITILSSFSSVNLSWYQPLWQNFFLLLLGCTKCCSYIQTLKIVSTWQMDRLSYLLILLRGWVSHRNFLFGKLMTFSNGPEM